jgi:CRP/FNR family transcriptional regulator, cyclic AMP receptor protein
VDPESTLRQVPLFANLQPKQLKSLAKWAVSRNFAPGQTIVSQGQLGLGLYCIQAGRVKITQKTAGGEREIREMGQGESFGELSLLSDRPRSATVTAIDPTTCILLDKPRFLAEIRTYPEIALEILPVLVNRLLEADQRVAELS